MVFWYARGKSDRKICRRRTTRGLTALSADGQRVAAPRPPQARHLWILREKMCNCLAIRYWLTYNARLVGAWRSLVAHLHGVQGVASSNPAAPTIYSKSIRANLQVGSNAFYVV